MTAGRVHIFYRRGPLHTFPLFSIYLAGGKSLSVLSRVKIMEFMGLNCISPAAEKSIFLSRQRDVAESHKFFLILKSSLQNAGQLQIQKTTAFCKHRSPSPAKGAQAFQHGSIFCQLHGKELRITAANVKTAAVSRNTFVIKG